MLFIEHKIITITNIPNLNEKVIDKFAEQLSNGFHLQKVNCKFQ